jgi:lactoylglutathione lyase
MVVSFGAYVMFSVDVERTTAFYRALGLPLEGERHGDGPLHFACDLGGVHVAVQPGKAGGDPPDERTHRLAGDAFHGYQVPDLQACLDAIPAADLKVEEPASMRPWGERVLLRDPDGRVVELFQPKQG